MGKENKKPDAFLRVQCIYTNSMCYHTWQKQINQLGVKKWGRERYSVMTLSNPWFSRNRKMLLQSQIDKSTFTQDKCNGPF